MSVITQRQKLLATPVKICLFIVSYIPLFVILGILHYDNFIMMYVLITITLIGSIGLIATFYVLNRTVGEYKQSETIEPTSKINFGYFLSYVIPFLAINFDSERQIMAYIVLSTFIAILYIRTELIYVNPTLVIFGYNLFKIKTKDNEEIMIITKQDHNNVLSNPIVPIDGNFYYERKTIIRSDSTE